MSSSVPHVTVRRVIVTCIARAGARPTGLRIVAPESFGEPRAHVRLRVAWGIDVEARGTEPAQSGKHQARAALFTELPAHGVGVADLGCVGVVTDLVRDQELLMECGAAKLVPGHDLRQRVVAVAEQLKAARTVLVDAAESGGEAGAVDEVLTREEVDQAGPAGGMRVAAAQR